MTESPGSIDLLETLRAVRTSSAINAGMRNALPG
jgi:hypothetical protein